MEQPHVATLNPMVSLSPFPPHRRRHLKSETFCTLVRILSHCYDASQPPQLRPLSADNPTRKSGCDDNELQQTIEVQGDADGTTIVDSEKLSVIGDASCLELLNVSKSGNDVRMEINEYDSVNRISNEFVQDNDVGSRKSLEEMHMSSSGIQLAAIDVPQDNLIGTLLDDLETVAQVEVDGENQNCELTEAFDLSVDVDEPAESLKLGGNEVGRSLNEESSELHQADLEKSLSNCGLMNFDEEVEEGEISGDFVIDDQFMDFLLGEEQTSETIVNEKEISMQHRQGMNEEEKRCDMNFEEAFNGVGNGVKLKLQEINVSEMESKSERVIPEKGEAKLAHEYERVSETVSNQKQADKNDKELEHIAMAGKMLGESAYQGVLSADKDGGTQKKRKRSMTQEKRAKKKKKERIKRAENRRKLGVKRLKIQPLVKPKPVTYCRHYLKGRCQEGEKCKFSHDTIPLTKSKPCCHFARNSCMKGDDCPYDHQLSKYPCNNYLSNGFCNRGTECLFSHEVAIVKHSPNDVNPSNSQPKIPSLSGVTNSERQKNLHSSSDQKVDSKSCSTGLSLSENTEQNAVVQPLKGMSKLLFGSSSLSNPSKLDKKTGTSSKVGGSVKLNSPLSASTNEIAKLKSPVEPMAINFLSFGKAPIHDCTKDKDLDKNNTPNTTSEIKEIKRVAGPIQPKGINFPSFGKAHAHDSSKNKEKDKQVTSPLKQEENLKRSNQNNENKRDLLSNLSEMPKRTGPSILPRGINFLSFSDTPINSSGKVMEMARSYGDNRASSSAHESERVKNPIDPLGKDTLSGSALKALFSNGRSSALKALQSTLAFAAKYESRIKVDHPLSSLNSLKGSTGLDGSDIKQ